MKRLHVNLAVSDLEASVRFYTSLFDAPPTVLKSDYAKWMMDDPRVNFALSTRGTRKGVDHLGVQVENEDELNELYTRLRNTAAPVLEQGETTCCYARSEKNWIVDPEGIAWETFLTKGESPVYGSDDPRISSAGSACCANAPREDGAASACCDAGGQS
ncbi:MAG: ArsI/CadI family heavy metal resistance metalloenzyme [Arenicellales bacterium]